MKLTEEIERWLEEEPKILQRRFEEQLTPIIGEIVSGYYNSETFVKLSALPSNEDLSVPQRLESSRWYVVACTLRAVSQSGGDVRGLLQPLKDLLEHMKAGEWPSASSRLRGLQPLVQGSSTAAGLLRRLELDLEYHHKLAWAGEEHLSQEVRLEHYAAAERALRELKEGPEEDREHARLVEGSAGSVLPGVLMELRRRVEKEKETAKGRNRLQQMLEKIVQELEEAARRESPQWLPIRHFLAEMEKERMAQPMVQILLSLDRAMQGGMSPVALDAADSTLRRSESELTEVPWHSQELQKAVKALIHRLAWRELTSIAASRPLWPLRVQEGLRFGQALQRSRFGEGQHQSEIDGLIKWLGERASLQSTLRESAGLVRPGDALDNLDKAEIDDALREAMNQDVELFDPSSENDGAPAVSVRSLLVKRDEARLVHRRDRLIDDLAQIKGGLSITDGRIVVEPSFDRAIGETREGVDKIREVMGTSEATESLEPSPVEQSQPVPDETIRSGLRDLLSTRRLWWAIGPLALAVILTVAGWYFRGSISTWLHLPGSASATPTKTATLPIPTPAKQISVPQEPAFVVDRIEFDLPDQIHASGGPQEIRVKVIGTGVDGVTVWFSVDPPLAGLFEPAQAEIRQDDEVVTQFVPGGAMEGAVSITASVGPITKTKHTRIVPARPPRLSLHIVADPPGHEVRPGQTITHSVSVSNVGEGHVTGLVVTCDKPEGVDDLWVDESLGSRLTTDQIILQAPPDSTLGAGEALPTLVFRYVIPADQEADSEIPPVRCQAGANRIEPRSAQGPEFVVKRPQFEILDLTVMPTEVAVGESITITARVLENAKPAAGRQVTITVGSREFLAEADGKGEISEDFQLEEEQAGQGITVTISYQDVLEKSVIDTVYPVAIIKENANIRSTPSDSIANFITQATPGQRFWIIGTQKDIHMRLWLRICCINDGQAAWLAGWLNNVEVKGGLTDLLEVPAQ